MREKEKATTSRLALIDVTWTLQGLLRSTTPRAEIAHALSGIVQGRGCRLAQEMFWLEVLDVWCEHPSRLPMPTPSRYPVMRSPEITRIAS